MHMKQKGVQLSTHLFQLQRQHKPCLRFQLFFVRPRRIQATQLRPVFAQDNSGDMDLEGFDVETFMEMVNAAGLRFHVPTSDEREDWEDFTVGIRKKGRGLRAYE